MIIAQQLPLNGERFSQQFLDFSLLVSQGEHGSEVGE